MTRALLALAAAVAAGCVSFALAYGLSLGIERLFPPEVLGPSAAEGVFDGSRSATQIAWLAVVFAPMYETLLAQSAPLEFARWLRWPAVWGVVASAAVFGLAHWLGGGIGHGVVSFAMGLVFASVYLAFRRDGPFLPWAVAAGAHGINNGLALWLVH